MSDERFHATVFSRRPDEDAPHVGLDVIRAPLKGTLIGICLSHDTTGCYLHFYKGRSRPCTGQNCDACKNNSDRRWKSYLILFDEKTRQQSILELTHSAAQQLHSFFDEHRTLRGYPLKVERIGGRANSKVKVRVALTRLADETLPKCPSIEPMLLRMWEIREADLQPYQSEQQPLKLAEPEIA